MISLSPCPPNFFKLGLVLHLHAQVLLLRNQIIGKLVSLLGFLSSLFSESYFSLIFLFTLIVPLFSVVCSWLTYYSHAPHNDVSLRTDLSLTVVP